MTAERVAELEARIQELLTTIVRLTNETPFPDEIRDALEQRGKLVAEVGTLRARVGELEKMLDDAMPKPKPGAVAAAYGMLDVVYRERNRLVAALARIAIKLGGSAGIGRHQPDQDPAWDPLWLNVIFIDTPHGQLSWHIHDNDRPLFEGIPPYTKPWDGHTTEEKYARLEKLR